MKKIFRKLHLWLSIPFGLIISIICLSGATLVFESEIMELCYPGRYFVKQSIDKPLPIEELLPTVAKTLPDSISITGVSISSDPGRAYQVNLSRPRRASAPVNQYTGEVKERQQRTPFFTTMLRLHRWLLDSMRPGGGMSVGKTIVGVSTIVFVFILITGIVIWIPRTRKGLKNRMKISVKKGWRRFWYDLHVAGGIYTTIVLLVLALTGLTWSFSWYRTGFYKVFGVEVQQQAPHGGGGQQQQRAPHGGSGNQSQNTGQREERQERQGRGERPERAEGQERRERQGRTEGQEGRSERGERQGNQPQGERDRQQTTEANFTCWQKVYEQLAQQNPDFKQISISNGSANVTFAKIGNQRGSDRYTFDPESGKITGSTLYKDLEKSGKIRGWIYSVHVGSWGGMTTKILSFLASLLGGILPITGYYLWFKRVYGKKGRKANKKRNKSI